MRIALCLILLMVLAVPARAASDEGVFRGFVWGVTKEDVRKYEKARFYQEAGDTLQFLEKQNDVRRLITYEFKDGGMVGAKYEMVELNDPNPQKILARSMDWANWLRERYGQPTREDLVWKDKFYRNRPDFWYRPLQTGDLKIISEWAIPGGIVTLQTYYDGLYYQLFYTAQKTDGVRDDGPAQQFRNLAPQDTKTPR